MSPAFPGRGRLVRKRRLYTAELLKAIDRVGSDENWLERLKEYFRENAPDLWGVSYYAYDHAIEALPEKHDAETVALWTERLEALKVEFTEERKRRYEREVRRRQAEIAKAKKQKEEAAKAKEESTLTYRLGNAINRWIYRLSGHDVDTDAADPPQATGKKARSPKAR